MIAIKVKNNDGLIGLVNVADWANPKTYLLDFVREDGDTKVEERDDLKYLGIEEY